MDFVRVMIFFLRAESSRRKFGLSWLSGRFSSLGVRSRRAWSEMMRLSIWFLEEEEELETTGSWSTGRTIVRPSRILKYLSMCFIDLRFSYPDFLKTFSSKRKCSMYWPPDIFLPFSDISCEKSRTVNIRRGSRWINSSFAYWFSRINDRFKLVSAGRLSRVASVKGPLTFTRSVEEITQRSQNKFLSTSENPWSYSSKSKK